MPDHREPEYAPQAVQAVRTATLVNLTLSQMADQKANMLLGATLVVMTLICGKFVSGPLPLPLVVMGAFAFVTALLAITVVMPSVAAPECNADRLNLMFFAAFTQLDEDEFAERMLVQLRSDEAMFRMMLRDIHQNGQVLRRKKYRLLGLAYRSMLTGLVCALLALLAENRAMLLAAIT